MLFKNDNEVVNNKEKICIVLKEVINFAGVSDAPYTKVLLVTRNQSIARQVLLNEISRIVNRIDGISEEKKK